MQSHLFIDKAEAAWQLLPCLACNKVYWHWMLSELMINPNIMIVMEVAPLGFDSSGLCSALPSSLEMKAAAKQGRLALSPLISLLFSLTDLWSYLDPKARHTHRVWSLLCSPQDLALVLFHVFTFSHFFSCLLYAAWHILDALMAAEPAGVMTCLCTECTFARVSQFVLARSKWEREVVKRQGKGTHVFLFCFSFKWKLETRLPSEGGQVGFYVWMQGS